MLLVLSGVLSLSIVLPHIASHLCSAISLKSLAGFSSNLIYKWARLKQCVFVLSFPTFVFEVFLFHFLQHITVTVIEHVISTRYFYFFYMIIDLLE